MLYYTSARSLQYSKTDNAFYCEGEVATDFATMSACYYIPVFGIPYLELTKREYNKEKKKYQNVLEVELRSGYPPMFRIGRRKYRDCFIEGSEVILEHFARQVNYNPKPTLVPICESLSHNLKFYLENQLYDITWKPSNVDEVPYDGTISLGVDAKLERPKTKLYFKLGDCHNIEALFLYGIVWTVDNKMRTYSIDVPELASYLHISDDMREELCRMILAAAPDNKKQRRSKATKPKVEVLNEKQDS